MICCCRPGQMSSPPSNPFQRFKSEQRPASIFCLLLCKVPLHFILAAPSFQAEKQLQTRRPWDSPEGAARPRPWSSSAPAAGPGSAPRHITTGTSRCHGAHAVMPGLDASLVTTEALNFLTGRCSWAGLSSKSSSKPAPGAAQPAPHSA